jgi:hypothetical protein
MFKKKRRGCGCLLIWLVIMAGAFVILARFISPQEQASASLSPTAIPVPSATTDPALTQFSQDAAKILTGYHDAFVAFSSLAAATGQDPTLLLSDSWKSQMLAVTTAIKQLDTQVYIVKAPPTYQAAWDQMRGAADKYDAAMNALVKGIDAVDANRIAQAQQLMREGNAAVTRASSLLPKD